MKCAPDVAHLLTGLTTRNGHLPQGSPASPILSFYSAFDMWMEIEAGVREVNCVISLYVDDITISGDVVPERMVWQVKEALKKGGHRFSKRKEAKKHRYPAEVTGLIVGSGKASMPHRHYKNLLQAREDALKLENEDDRSRAKARARSLEYQVQAVRTR